MVSLKISESMIDKNILNKSRKIYFQRQALRFTEFHSGRGTKRVSEDGALRRTYLQLKFSSRSLLVSVLHASLLSSPLYCVALFHHWAEGVSGAEAGIPSGLWEIDSTSSVQCAALGLVRNGPTAVFGTDKCCHNDYHLGDRVTT